MDVVVVVVGGGEDVWRWMDIDGGIGGMRGGK